MASFGDPTYAADDAAQQQQLDAAMNQQQNILDPDSPEFMSEPLEGVNLEADAYAKPTPPPDGIYRAKLSIEEQDWTDAATQTKVKRAWTPAVWGQKDPQKVAVLHVIATLIDPSGKYDGLKVYERTMSTMMKRDGSHKVGTLLTKLRKPDGSSWITGGKLGPGQWASLLVQALAGEPEIGIETEWEWSCDGCAEEAKKKGERRPRAIVGMRNFPIETDPIKRRAGVTNRHEIVCQVNQAHGNSRAQVRVGRWLSLAELQQVQASRPSQPNGAAPGFAAAAR